MGIAYIYLQVHILWHFLVQLVYSINTLRSFRVKDEKIYPPRRPKRHDNLDILREKRRRHKVQTKRETFQQAIKYILDAFCESFAAGLWRCNFLNVSDVAVLQRCHPLQLLSSHSTSILIAKYGDNFKEVKDIDAA